MSFDTEFAVQTLIVSIKAVPVTLKIVTVSFLLAFIPAFGIALARIKKIMIIAIPARFFVSANRGFPILLQILIIYSFVPGLLNSLFVRLGLRIKIFDVNPIVYAYIVFTFHCMASVSEIFRSSLLTVSEGQYEASLCIGLSPIQAYRRIILPQALVSALPNLCNTIVGLLKSTALVYYMTIKDVTGAAMNQASIGCNYIEAYLDVFLVYVVLCSGTQLLFSLFENQMSVRRNGGIKIKSYFFKFVL